MAITVYPDTGWNSFTDVVTADTILGSFVNDGGYSALETLDKEKILTQTALQIRLCNSITLPATAESDLQLAQCFLVAYALEIDMLSYDVNEKAISEEHAGEVGQSFDPAFKARDNSSYPPMVNDLLKQYGCTKTSGGFSQPFLGRG